MTRNIGVFACAKKEGNAKCPSTNAIETSVLMSVSQRDCNTVTEILENLSQNVIETSGITCVFQRVQK